MLFLYKCPRCSITTFFTQNYINHLKQKDSCKPTLSNDNLEKEYIKYNIKEKLLQCQKINNQKLFSELKDKLSYYII